MRKHILLFASYFILTVIFYHKALGSYFEGDEWFYFANFSSLTNDPLVGIIKSFWFSIKEAYWLSGGGHIAPIQGVLFYCSLLFFKLNFSFYIFTSLLLHAANTFLLYRLIRRLTNSFSISFLVSLIFLGMASHFQAVSWVMVTIYDLLLVLLVLSICLLVLTMNKVKSIHFLLIVFFSICSLLIKESAVIIFILVPLLGLFFNKKVLKILLFFIAILICFYIPFRFGLPQLFAEGKVFQNSSLSIVGFVEDVIRVIPRMVLQDFIPFKAIQVEYISNSWVYLAVYIFIFLLGLFGIRSRFKTLNKMIGIGAVFILITSVLIVLTNLYSPYKQSFEIIESRYLYFVTIGAAFMITGILQAFSGFSLIKPGIRIIPIALLTVYLLLNYVWLQDILQPYKDTGEIRKEILRVIRSDVSSLSSSTVFLVESDTGYYGFENIPPFQTNLGQILAISYNLESKLDKVFVEDRSIQKTRLDMPYFLKNQNRFFGYFTNRKTLYEIGYKHRIGQNSIQAFSWSGKDKKLTNISQEFRRLYQEEMDSRSLLSKWQQTGLSTFDFKIDKKFTKKVISSDYAEFESSSVISIQKIEKDPLIFFHDYVSEETDSEGQPILSNWKLVNINNLNHGLITCIYTLSGKYPVYFVPSYDGKTYIKLFAVGNEYLREDHFNDEQKRNKMLESVISSIKYFTN